MRNPYPADASRWSKTTDGLLQRFPLPMGELVKVVLASWEDIFHSQIGARKYQIGRDVWPEPQIMGFLLHELVPLNLAASFPGVWRRCLSAADCDAVYVPDDDWSFEIKTSSSRSGIFGNRSYAHVSGVARKRRGSFFLAVNFGKFGDRSARPEVTLIRFGWLGASDWVADSGPNLANRPTSRRRPRPTSSASCTNSQSNSAGSAARAWIALIRRSAISQ